MSSQARDDMLEDGQKVPQRGLTWNGVAAGERQMAGSSLNNFLGGSPLGVLVRLLFISLIVGALLTWIGITPFELLRNIRQIGINLWNMGFGAFREVADYVLAGAVIVLPVWLILRVLNSRSRR